MLGWPWIKAKAVAAVAVDAPIALPEGIEVESKTADAEESVMSAGSVAVPGTAVTVTPESNLTKVEGDVKGFFANLVTDVRKARQIWTLVSSAQTRAFLIKAGADVVKLAQDAALAGAAKGLNFTMDEATYNDALQLIADAKAGDSIIVADLKILGITI